MTQSSLDFLRVKFHSRATSCGVRLPTFGTKRTRPLPKVLTVEEVDRLIATAHARAAEKVPSLGERARRVRTACFIELLYATGLRVSELAALPASAAGTKGEAIIVRC